MYSASDDGKNNAAKTKEEEGMAAYKDEDEGDDPTSSIKLVTFDIVRVM